MSNADDPWNIDAGEPDPLAPGATDDARTARSSNNKKVLLGCFIAFAVVAGLLFASLAGLGLLLEAGYLPPEEVRTGDETSERHLERVREIGALDDGEEVLLFYSWGLLDAAEGGSMLTDRGVTTWYPDDVSSDLVVLRVPYAAIDGAEITTEGSLIEDSVITVSTPAQSVWFMVSPSEAGDERFLSWLLEEWEERGGHRPEDVADDALEYLTYTESVVLLEDEIDVFVRAQLKDAGIVQEGVAIHALCVHYPDDPTNIGTAITEAGVATWYWRGQEWFLDRIPFPAIQSVRIAERGDRTSASTIVVETPRLEYWFEAQEEDGGDFTFVRALRKRWRSAGGFRSDAIPEWFEDDVDRFLESEDD